MTELYAIHRPAWTPSSLLREQDGLVLFRFPAPCPEADPGRGLGLLVLGTEPGVKGQLLAWDGNVDWGLTSRAFLPVLHRDLVLFVFFPRL